jgi:TrmH family RNA methyltransferase
MRSIETITSRDNQRLKLARQIRDGRESRYIFIEGRRLAAEALRSELVIRECFISASVDHTDLIEEPSLRSAAIAQVPERVFETIADTAGSQGIILIAERPPAASAALIATRINASKLPLVIFLNEINNPANLGAVFRTAEAAGVAGVITSRNSADVYSPKSLRAAMGSAFRLSIWDNAVFNEVLSWSGSIGLTPTATDTDATMAYTELDWRTPRLLIFGSEAHGLKDLDTAGIKDVIRIPIEPQVDSLNLAISAGIILFEARRQINEK